MSDLVVAVFKDEFKAEEVRLDLMKMDRKHLVDLEDAIVVVRKKNGKVKLHHVSHLTIPGAVGGGFLGTLVGAMLFNPIFGIATLAAGTVIGAVYGSHKSIGLEEDFMRDLAAHLKPGTSAVCALVTEHIESVIEDMEKFGGKVFQTTLAHEDEEKLLAAIDAAKAEA